MIELKNIKATRKYGTINIPYLVLPTVGRVALIGLKNSGKTTLLKILSGLTEYRGEVVIDDGLKLKKYTCNFGYLDFIKPRKYQTNSFKQALDNTMKVYGIKESEKCHENSLYYLHLFDLTQNDNYEELDKSRQSLFSLAILLSLELPVLLLDNLFDTLDESYQKLVEETLNTYASKHLVITSYGQIPSELSFNLTIAIDKGQIVKEIEGEPSNFKPSEFKKNKSLDLETFTLLPHLSNTGKLLIAILSALFTFVIAAFSESLAPNINALERASRNTFTPISSRYEGHEDEIYNDYQNHSLFLYNEDEYVLTRFAIRPYYDSTKLVSELNYDIGLSRNIARVLNVDVGDTVYLSRMEFEVTKITNATTQEIYVSYPLYIRLANDSTNPLYQRPTSDFNNVTYYDKDGNMTSLTSGTYYYQLGVVLNEDQIATNYGYYESENFSDPYLVITHEVDESTFLSHKETTNYVVHFTRINDLRVYRNLEDSDFVYNLITPNVSVIIVPIFILVIYLGLIITIYLKADKDDSDYYLSFSKHEYVFLQALKFFCFNLVTLFSSLLLVVTLSRESLLLTITISILGGSMILFFILYLIIARITLKDYE